MLKKLQLAALIVSGLTVSTVAAATPASAAPFSPSAAPSGPGAWLTDGGRDAHASLVTALSEAASPGYGAPSAPPDGANGAVGGPVSTVSGSTYTIAGPDGSSVTITATSSTTYVNADGSSADASAVKAGVIIGAEGTPSNDGKPPTAQKITIGKPQGGTFTTNGGERAR